MKFAEIFSKKKEFITNLTRFWYSIVMTQNWSQLLIYHPYSISKVLIIFVYAILTHCAMNTVLYNRGGKMCQIVEGHNINVPSKNWARKALFTNLRKGGRAMPSWPPQFCHPCIFKRIKIWYNKRVWKHLSHKPCFMS